MSLGIDLSNIDILNLEWPSSDRDLHIVTPVLVYLKKKHNIQYKTVSIFNGYYYILKYKPKMILISNFQGASLNNEIIKLSYILGIKVVSFISEGNVKELALDQFLWGWNKDKKLYVDKMLLWSKRSERLFVDKYPELKDKLVTTGATGFDRYQLLTFKSKKEFLKENNLKFEKIIGIAAWGFDHYFGEYFEKNKNYYLKVFGEEQIEMHKSDLYKIQEIYKKLIENNKDILFILRFHPGTIDFEKNEFYGLDKFDNVYISNKFNKNYQITDLINISDLWIGYETTTALESWLLNKQTFLINPTRSDFIRENVHKGSPIALTYSEAQKYIDEFFETSSIKDFELLQEYRSEIISAVIEYQDGNNYIRAAEEIIKVFNSPDRKIILNRNIYLLAFKQLLKVFLSKTIFKNRWRNLNYDLNFAQSYQEQYVKVIDG